MSALQLGIRTHFVGGKTTDFRIIYDSLDYVQIIKPKHGLKRDMNCRRIKKDSKKNKKTAKGNTRTEQWRSEDQQRLQCWQKVSWGLDNRKRRKDSAVTSSAMMVPISEERINKLQKLSLKESRPNYIPSLGGSYWISQTNQTNLPLSPAMFVCSSFCASSIVTVLHFRSSSRSFSLL